MKRKWIGLVVAAIVVGSVLVGCQAPNTETANADKKEMGTDGNVKESEKEAEPYVVSVDTATVTGAMDAEGNEVTPELDADRKMYGGFAEGACIEYVVPEGVDGVYDVYANMERPAMLWGSTPFIVTVNGNNRQVQPIDMTTTYDASGVEGLTPGMFLVAKEMSIKAGDKLTFTVNRGMMNDTSPYVGDVVLYETGSEVAQGFGDMAAVVKEDGTVDESDPLSGKTILWMGSSVTFGMMANGYSMADYMAENHVGNKAVKYAISGTTLVNDGQKSGSYVERLENDVWEGYDDEIDLVVIQLSTNDATAGKPLGTLSDSMDKEDFDVATITGAEEYLIAYAKERWGCDVVFYTGSYYEAPAYAEMVEGVKEVCDKWNVGLINLWDNQEMVDLYGTEKYKEYMPMDGIHPNKLGYSEWWAPEFEKYLSEYLTR